MGFVNWKQRGAVAFTAILITGCGGGGGGGGGDNQPKPQPPEPSPTSSWVSGVFESSSEFVNLCEVPRTGTDPSTGALYPDMQGTVLDQNNWLRSWMNDTYHWYSEVSFMWSVRHPKTE